MPLLHLGGGEAGTGTGADTLFGVSVHGSTSNPLCGCQQ